MELLFKFKGLLLKPKPKIYFFNFYFEFFNTHISHLAQLPMIIMTLKWHHKNISNKIKILKKNDNFLTWFLAPLIMITPQNQTFFFHFIIL